MLLSNPYFPAVNSLDLRNITITEDDLIKLNSLSSRMRSVKDLYFSNSKIENKRALMLFLSALASQIEILDLSNLNITLEDIGFLSGALDQMRNLRILYLDNNNISDEGLHKLMNQGFDRSRLRILSLKSNNLTDDSLKRFSQFLIDSFGDMEILDLRENDPSNEGLEMIVKYSLSMPNLIALDIDSRNMVKSDKVELFLKCVSYSSEVFVDK